MRILKYALSALFILFSLSNSAIADNAFEAIQASADHSATQVNKTRSVDVLKNDKGINLSISAVSAFSQEGGKAVINLSKTKINYTPAQGFSGIDSFWYEITDNNHQIKTALVTVLVSSSLAQRNGTLDFKLIPIHYQLLNGEPHTWRENGGLTPFNLANNAKKGDKTIILNGDSNLHESELIVYLSTSGNYHVAQVANKNGNTITLTQELDASIAAGNHLWNFYKDSSHPNSVGYKALADFSISQLDTDLLENKVHAFIGDSWLDNGVIENRIKSKINVTNTINKAVGGSRTNDTLNTFDDNFPPNEAAPDFFWVTLSTNDYWQHTSSQDYLANMTLIIEKINALGATAIILNSSVAPYVFDESLGELSSHHKDLSHSYADGLLTLADNNQGDSGDGGSGDGGSGDDGSGDDGSGDGGSGDGGSGDGGSGDSGSGDGGSDDGSSGAIPSQNGGGSLIWFELLLLMSLSVRRRKNKL